MNGISLLFISGILVLAACSKGNPSLVESDDGLNSSEELLAPNIRYQVSYDEELITYSKVWPEDITSGLYKQNTTSDLELVMDYEAKSQKMGFDEEGNMIITYKYRDGNEEMNMPSDLYEQVKDEMPARAPDHRPTASFQLKDGLMTYFDESGGAIIQEAYPIERYKLDPAVLDSMKAAAESNASPEAKVAKNLKLLDQEGINFSLLGDSYASFSIDVNEYGIGKYEKLIDLKTGEEVKSSTVLANGDYESITVMKYETVNGHNVLSNSETLNFGLHNGEWGVTGRTLLTRKNINVIFN